MALGIITYSCLFVNQFRQQIHASLKWIRLWQAGKGQDMSYKNSTRSGCKDVFRSFLVKNAQYSGRFEIPIIPKTAAKPNKLIPFSKSIGSCDFDSWVHFYEDDVNFERIWNTPQKYLPILKKFKGVITPDFSLYRDMPLAMQIWNTYRGKAIGNWLVENGISTIPNVRWGDQRTFDFCCNGIAQKGTIAIGSHGCIKLLTERPFFEAGLEHVVKTILPRTIVVYGAAPDNIFDKYVKCGIDIIQFDSVYMSTHRKAVES